MKDEDTLDLFESAGVEPEAQHGAGEGTKAEPADGRDTAEAAPDGSPDAAGDTGEADEDSERDSEDAPRVWQVSEVNRAVRDLLRRSVAPLWVGGEVANWTRARSGHRYFTLKDEHAQLRCVMWRGDAARLPMDPEEGMRVRAYGSVDLYEVRGEYQLQVRRVEAEGEDGLWKLAFEKLRLRLESEGLLAPERKRPLPAHPTTVGIVTSTTGAAIRDILSVLRRRAPWVRVVVRGCRVQGDGASQEVAAGLRFLAERLRPDVVVVGRGGGSIEDLWAFNEEPVARAIAECPVPVVSAVGHETDVTISDLVADLRAPTPSAAAEAVVRDRAELEEVLDAAGPRLGRALRRTVERRAQRLRDLGGRIERGVRGCLDPAKVAVERRHERMERCMRALLEGRRRRLEGLAGRVDALSPMGTLRRGYAVALDPAGRVLCRGRDFQPGTAFELRVLDAGVPAQVTEEPRPRAEEVPAGGLEEDGRPSEDGDGPEGGKWR